VKEKPNYYAVIPANVRYDNELTPLAKILYAEISALSSAKGICWATNNYFANLYQITNVQVSRTIDVKTPINKKVNTPINKNVNHNIIKDNNTRVNIYIRDNEDFERFWSNLQGRKKNKNDALKAYIKIDTDMSAEDLAFKFNQLLHIREEKYVPYPQKWLKNEGWLEEIKEESSGKAWVSDSGVYRDADGYIISKEEFEKLQN
jgi:post-segregation antitoxin (ccd killing protein)